MKGQVSTELLVVVALVLLVFIPLLVMVYMKANEANQEIASYQADLAVSRIASLANSVGSLGSNTWVTTDIYLPPNTIDLRANQSGRGGEITLRLKTPQGETEPSDVVKYRISNPGIVADSSAAGSWARIRITSVYSGGETTLKIEKVS